MDTINREERRADRNTAFGEAELRLVDGDAEETVVVGRGHVGKFRITTASSAVAMMTTFCADTAALPTESRTSAQAAGNGCASAA